MLHRACPVTLTEECKLLANSYKAALRQAKDNAVYFGVPYVVFRDTSGNWRCERKDKSFSCHTRRDAKVVRPGRQASQLLPL